MRNASMCIKHLKMSIQAIEIDTKSTFAKIGEFGLPSSAKG
jgi:hypothetical protein